MIRAGDSAQVSGKSYRGKIAVLYFGYTHCPDVCPATLANLADVLKQLGPASNRVRVLFVTVDPARDTEPELAAYVRSFSDNIDGLRGDPNALTALARRYRVAFGRTPATSGQPYGMMHSEAVFFFGPDGHARFVATSTDNHREILSLLRHLLDP